MTFKNGLRLNASVDNHDLGTFLGQYIKSVDFDIIAEVETGTALTGISLGGAIAKSKWPGELGGIGITAAKDGYTVFSNLEGKYTVLKQSNESLSGATKLRMKISKGGKQIDLFYKNGVSDWLKFHTLEFNASKYVPWGMGYRAGIVVKGQPSEQGVFKSFELKNN
ncbi:hypothetical protein D3C86_835210 [compost metagenome]